MLETDKVILCAVAKNEAPYLVEWITYHRLIVGFDQVLIYENDSRDDSKFLLQELQKLGLCLYQTWPRKSGLPPQQSAYDHAVKTQNKLYKWICFLDLDEFLVLKDFSSVQDCISHFQDKADTILINWRMFGSSGHEKYDPAPLIQRFTKCANSYNPVQGHMKSISKIDQIQTIDIHISRLKDHSRYFHIDGTEIFYGDQPQMEHITNRGYMSHKSGQINHYFLKSAEEFKCKIMKGTASVSKNHPESRFRIVDFHGLNPEYNLAEEFIAITTINKLNYQIDAIYESLAGKKLWTDKFKMSIRSEASEYDRLANSSILNDRPPCAEKFRDSEQVLAKTDTLPPWAPESIGKIAEYLMSHNNSQVLEFGSSYSVGSTMWLAEYSINLTSIQDNQSIFLSLRSKLDEREISNVSLIFQEQLNVQIVDQFPDHHFDLILVQTEDIKDCIKSSIKKVKDGGLILLNNAQRTRYREGRNLLEAFPCIRYYHPHHYTQIWFIRHDLDYLNLDVQNPFE